MRFRTVKFSIGALAATAGLAACGSGNSGRQAPGGGAPASTTAPETVSPSPSFSQVPGGGRTVPLSQSFNVRACHACPHRSQGVTGLL